MVNCLCTDLLMDPHHQFCTRALKSVEPALGRTGRVRYRFTGPVRPETTLNRMNSNFKSKFIVQSVWSGILTGPTGIPVRFDWFPIV
jgi:hypothetical protein